MRIERQKYLEMLINRQHNGMIKVITGVRRCGKSYLLFELFREHLLGSGVDENHIITIPLDIRRNAKFRDPEYLLEHIDSLTTSKGMYYILLDEVQMLRDFESVLNELLHYRNVDVYVTGSNSKFLSSDILTEFRGRGDEVRVHPLNFAEFVSVFEGSVDAAWQEYFTYGGLPMLPSLKTEEQKIKYLVTLFNTVYIKDIKERNKIRHERELEILLGILASSIGSLANPLKLANTFQSKRGIAFPESTIARYCNYLEDAFLLNKSERYDVNGKSYISTPYKYYFEDIGLRNARLNFRQMEENHIMENVIYNELKYRGFAVDVGVVELREKQENGNYLKKQTEIDFVANSGNRRYYLQSAFAMDSESKEFQEKRPYQHLADSFKKIVLVRDNIKVRRDDNGIVTMGLFDFLLNPHSLEV